ncbi:MAG TPA: ABC-three component system middle component 2 [Acidobacteriaceae bacterium]|nr:ABC-three component system middle component 2 [Acidobacteriaceae bacterium]
MSQETTFNSPLECGLRALALLEASSQRTACDLQRLVFYDYLLVHSGDVTDGPPSIHPATPLRSGEALVRRHWVERGLLLMLSRELIQRNFSNVGISYASTGITSPFLAYLEQPYTTLLRERAKWVVSQFGGLSDTDLVTYFKTNLDRWGGEFIFKEAAEDDTQ